MSAGRHSALAAFRAALRTKHTAEPPLIGIEHEYYLSYQGAPRDFQRLIHQLPIDGRRLDPGDVNAYRLTSGIAITCDESEAEIVTPPVVVTRGFSTELERWAAHGRATLRAMLPEAVALVGASTHLSVSAPDSLQDQACYEYAARFAPALMLLAERPDSHGIMVRPRPGRIELCTEYVDGPGLRLASVFVAGSVMASLDLARGANSRNHPAALKVTLEPSVERVGLQVRRRAFGPDLYAEGRAARLERAAGGQVSAQEHLEYAWSTARRYLGGANPADVRALDRLVAGSEPLPAHHMATQPRFLNPPRRSQFGELLLSREAGGVAIVAVLATWDFTVFRASAGDRHCYVSIPRPALRPFLRGLEGEQVPALVRAFLNEPPGTTALECYCQTALPGLWDTLGGAVNLLRPERQPETDGDATLHGAAASDSRPAKGGTPGRGPDQPEGTAPRDGPAPGSAPPPPPPPPPPGPTPPPPLPGPRPGKHDTHRGGGGDPGRPTPGDGPGRTPPPPPSPPPPPVVPPPEEPRRGRALKFFIWEPPHRGEEIPGHVHESFIPVHEDPGRPWKKIAIIFTGILILLGGGFGTFEIVNGGGTHVQETPGSPEQPSPAVPAEPSPGKPAEPSPATQQEPGGSALPSPSPQVAPQPTTGNVQPPEGPGAQQQPSPASQNPPGAPSPPPVETTGPVSPPETTGPAAPPPTTAPPAVATTPPPPVLSRPRTVSASVQSNPGNHPCAVGPTLTLDILITRDRSIEPNPVMIHITGSLPEMNGTTVIGPAFGSNGGTVTVNGTGQYCGFTTSYSMTFTITPTAISGTITIGENGSLPGGEALVLTFQGN